MSDWAIFTINIVNKNDAPLCSNDAVSIVEGAPLGANIGSAGLGDASDPDGDTLVWTLLYGDVDNEFALDASTGQLTIANNVTDFEERSSYTLRVKVADTGNEDAGGNLECEFNAVVSITDANDAPVIAANQALSVNENVASGTAAGTVRSTDEDAGDTAAFSFDPRTPSATTTDPVT